MSYFEKLSLLGFDAKLAVAAGLIYLVAIILLIISLTKARSYRGVLGLLIVGFVTHASSFLTRAILCQRLPIASLFEYILLFSLVTMLIYLIYLREAIGGAGLVAVLAIVFALLVGSPYFYSPPSTSLLPALRSGWLYVHVSLTIVSQTFFAIGFVASLLYILRHRSGGDVSKFDRIMYRSISIGFAFFTAGALVAGSLWAKKAWGSYWSWDPKEVMSLVVWLVYAVYLHARLVKGLAGVTSALISVLGFVLILLTAISTLFVGGLHSYR